MWSPAASTRGARRDSVSVLGVHLGSLVHVTAAAVGLSSLLVSSAVAFNVVKYAGAAYLIYLGVRALMTREEPRAVEVAPASKGRLLRQGAVVNILNPKTALFFLAFLPQFVDPDAGYVGAQLVFFGLVFVALRARDGQPLCARRGYRRRLAPHEQRLRRCAAVGLGHGLHRPRSRDRALRFSTEDVTSSSSCSTASALEAQRPVSR